MQKLLKSNSKKNNKLRSINALIIVSLLILVFFLFLFNVRYLSRFFDWDSSVYALNIQRNRLYSVFFNPHHLGFESTGFLFWKIWQSLFHNFDLMFALRIRILLFSCAFIYSFIYIIYKFYGSILQAIALGACVFFSQGFWFYSNHNDTPMIHSCLVCLLFFSFVYIANTYANKKRLFSIGLLQLMTLYFHQSNAILFPMAIISILITEKWDEKEFPLAKRLYAAFIYCLLVGIFIVASYLFVGFIILERDLHSFGEKHFSYWMFLYAAQERWGMSGTEKNYFYYFYRGIGDSFLNFQGVNSKFRVDLFSPLSVKNAAYNGNLFFWLLILAMGILNLRTMIRKFPKEMIILSFWLIPSILFYSWWEGYFFEFWVGVTIGLWLLSFYVLRSLEIPIFSNTFRASATVLYSVIALFLFSFNFTYSTLPRSKGVQYGYLEGFKDKVERIAKEKIYNN